MTGDQIKQWRHSLRPAPGRDRVSMADAARLLGTSLATYERYEANGRESRMLALAMSAISNGVPPWDSVERGKVRA